MNHVTMTILLVKEKLDAAIMTLFQVTLKLNLKKLTSLKKYVLKMYCKIEIEIITKNLKSVSNPLRAFVCKMICLISFIEQKTQKLY